MEIPALPLLVVSPHYEQPVIFPESSWSVVRTPVTTNSETASTRFAKNRKSTSLADQLPVVNEALKMKQRVLIQTTGWHYRYHCLRF